MNHKKGSRILNHKIRNEPFRLREYDTEMVYSTVGGDQKEERKAETLGRAMISIFFSYFLSHVFILISSFLVCTSGPVVCQIIFQCLSMPCGIISLFFCYFHKKNLGDNFISLTVSNGLSFLYSIVSTTMYFLFLYGRINEYVSLLMNMITSIIAIFVIGPFFFISMALSLTNFSIFGHNNDPNSPCLS
jgi:hypothetical protein